MRHRASPLYLDGNHLLHLHVQIQGRIACPLPVDRLAIAGRSAGRSQQIGWLWGWAFPGANWASDSAYQAAAAGPGEPHHPPLRRERPRCPPRRTRRQWRQKQPGWDEPEETVQARRDGDATMQPAVRLFLGSLPQPVCHQPEATGHVRSGRRIAVWRRVVAGQFGETATIRQPGSVEISRASASECSGWREPARNHIP